MTLPTRFSLPKTIRDVYKYTPPTHTDEESIAYLREKGWYRKNRWWYTDSPIAFRPKNSKGFRWEKAYHYQRSQDEADFYRQKTEELKTANPALYEETQRNSWAGTFGRSGG